MLKITTLFKWLLQWEQEAEGEGEKNKRESDAQTDKEEGVTKLISQVFFCAVVVVFVDIFCVISFLLAYFRNVH